jgi:peptidoglycan/LPS O-acetylase OafA/YrhL
LRFFAALWVFLYHLNLRHLIGPEWLSRIASQGDVGVSFFFVLSGFVLTYTYAGRKIDKGSFRKARAVRIYPAYLFSLLITAPFWLATILGDQQRHTLSHIASTILVLMLAQAWSPLAALAWNPVGWSLSIEWQFYTFFPRLLRWLEGLSTTSLYRLYVGAYALSIALGVAFTALIPLAKHSPDGFNMAIHLAKYNPIARLPEFLLGMSAGILFLRSVISPRYARLLVGCGACFLAVCLSLHLPDLVMHSMWSLPFCILIYAAAFRRRQGFLESAVLLRLGEASYSFYLLHLAVIDYVVPLSHRLWLVDTIAFLITLSAACLAYRYLEQPASRRMTVRAVSSYS